MKDKAVAEIKEDENIVEKMTEWGESV